MPTGYTAPIADGITFKEFAIRCAHQFLPAIRDQPMSATIPRQFVAGEYYKNAAAKAREDYDALLSMTSQQIAQTANAHHEARKRIRLESNARAESLRAKYVEMLQHIDTWEPPTDKHAAIKAFMRRQVEESMQWDCAPFSTEFAELDVDAWFCEQAESLRNAIAYNEKRHAEEVERARASTEWACAFLDSLPD